MGHCTTRFVVIIFLTILINSFRVLQPSRPCYGCGTNRRKANRFRPFYRGSTGPAKSLYYRHLNTCTHCTETFPAGCQLCCGMYFFTSFSFSLSLFLSHSHSLSFSLSISLSLSQHSLFNIMYMLSGSNISHCLTVPDL